MLARYLSITTLSSLQPWTVNQLWCTCNDYTPNICSYR